MLTDERYWRVADGVDAVIHDQAMREYVVSAARELSGRSSDFVSVEHERRLEGRVRAVERERARAAQARAVRKQMRAQRRASLSIGERVADSFRGCGRLPVVWLLTSVAVFGCAVLIAGLAARPTILAACAGAYIVALALTLKIVRRRLARALPEGFDDRVSDQLDRVKAAIPTSSNSQFA